MPLWKELNKKEFEMFTFIIKLFPLKDLILYSKERVLTKIVRRELIENDPRVKTTTFACMEEMSSFLSKSA